MGRRDGEDGDGLLKPPIRRALPVPCSVPELKSSTQWEHERACIDPDDVRDPIKRAEPRGAMLLG